MLYMAKEQLLDLSTLTDNVVSDDINEYSITLYGEGGSGKSTFANALKRKLGSSASFFFEPRAKGLGGIKVVQCNTWGTFLAYIKQLKQLAKAGTKVPFDNIIIDSVDSAYEKCTKHVMDENDWETLQGDYGARYTTVGSEFKNAIEELRNMGFIVTFLTHEKTKEDHDVSGAAFEKATPIVPSQIQSLVNDQVDMIMYLSKITVATDDGDKKEMRRLWFRNNPFMSLKTPLFGMPDYIEYENVNEGVDKFIAAFDKAVQITRDMHDSGIDISGANADNEKPIEFVQPKTTTFDDEDDFDDVDEDAVYIEALRARAIEIRDTMLESMEKSEVVTTLKSALGTASIGKCNDADKLNKFIADNE